MYLLKIDFALILLVVLSLAAGTLQGGGNRGAKERAFLAEAAATVDSFPVNLGTWRMVGDTPLTEDVLAILKCQDHVNRTYMEEQTGKRVDVIVLLGPSGPMVSHSPDVCLSSAHFEMLEKSEAIQITASDGKTLPVHRATFRSNDVGGQILRVYYAWVRPDGSWVAPASPRWVLGGDLGLWKIQVSTVVTEDFLDESDEEPAQRVADSSSGARHLVDSGEQFLIDNGSLLRAIFASYQTHAQTDQEND